jgi:predicted phage gp36 major capsid-like protein
MPPKGGRTKKEKKAKVLRQRAADREKKDSKLQQKAEDEQAKVLEDAANDNATADNDTFNEDNDDGDDITTGVSSMDGDNDESERGEPSTKKAKADLAAYV